MRTPTHGSTSLPLRRPGLIVQKRAAADGSVLVHDPVTGSGHIVNAAGAAVLAAADGATSREDMAEMVAAATELPADVGVVDLALDELMEAGLVSASEPSGLSRRALIGRLALAGAAVAALPVVLSVIKAGTAEAGGPGFMVSPTSATTEQGVAVAIPLPSSGGFSDPTSTLFWITSPAAHGTVTVSGSTATYTPDPGFAGVDSFDFTAGQCIPYALVAGPACPEGNGMYPEPGADPATVTVTVTASPESSTTSTTDGGVSPATATASPAVVAPNYTG